MGAWRQVYGGPDFRLPFHGMKFVLRVGGGDVVSGTKIRRFSNIRLKLKLICVRVQASPNVFALSLSLQGSRTSGHSRQDECILASRVQEEVKRA